MHSHRNKLTEYMFSIFQISKTVGLGEDQNLTFTKFAFRCWLLQHQRLPYSFSQTKNLFYLWIFPILVNLNIYWNAMVQSNNIHQLHHDSFIHTDITLSERQKRYHKNPQKSQPPPYNVLSSPGNWIDS